MKEMKIFLIVTCIFLFTSCSKKGESNPTSNTQVESGWVQGNGLKDQFVNVYASIDSTILFAGTDGNGVFRTTDNGTNWTKVGLGSGKVTSLVVINGVLFAGNSSLALGKPLYKSMDYGNTWVAIDKYPINASFSVNAMATAGMNLFAATDWDLYWSSDMGDHWKFILSSGAPLKQIQATLYFKLFLSWGDGISISIDSGKTFNNYQQDKAFVVLSMWGDICYLGAREGLYVAAHPYNSWTRLDSTFEEHWIYATLRRGKYLFVTTYRHIYLSLDLGITWKDITENNKYGNTYALAIFNGRIYTGGGWSRPLSDFY